MVAPVRMKKTIEHVIVQMAGREKIVKLVSKLTKDTFEVDAVVKLTQ